MPVTFATSLQQRGRNKFMLLTLIVVKAQPGCGGRLLTHELKGACYCDCISIYSKLLWLCVKITSRGWCKCLWINMQIIQKKNNNTLVAAGAGRDGLHQTLDTNFMLWRAPRAVDKYWALLQNSVAQVVLVCSKLWTVPTTWLVGSFSLRLSFRFSVLWVVLTVRCGTTLVFTKENSYLSYRRFLVFAELLQPADKFDA